MQLGRNKKWKRDKGQSSKEKGKVQIKHGKLNTKTYRDLKQAGTDVDRGMDKECKEEKRQT